MSGFFWVLLAYLLGCLMGVVLTAMLCVAGHHSRKEEANDQP
jgi:purine-cytosine permease-like protein